MLIHKCKNCTYYTAYYEKFSSLYQRLTHGSCRKHKKQLTQTDSCEEFKSNEQKEKKRLERTFESLEYALESINEISQILKENYDKIPD